MRPVQICWWINTTTNIYYIEIILLNEYKSGVAKSHWQQFFIWMAQHLKNNLNASCV